MNGGVPPTERNARTGELTPPGMRAARAGTVSGCVSLRARLWMTRVIRARRRKQRAEAARRRADVGRVEQRRDHRDAVGAGGDQLAAHSRAVMPPIATTGSARPALRVAQERERRAHRAGLDARRERSRRRRRSRARRARPRARSRCGRSRRRRGSCPARAARAPRRPSRPRAPRCTPSASTASASSR